MSQRFASDEAALFWTKITSSLDRLLALIDGLDASALNWRPPAGGANSLATLCAHVLANLEENILAVVCGLPSARSRDDEFLSVVTAPGALQAQWAGLRRRCQEGLAALDPAAMNEQRLHPRRGPVAVREVLLVVARHAEEHRAHAELTRDLWLAAPAATPPG